MGPPPPLPPVDPCSVPAVDSSYSLVQSGSQGQRDEARQDEGWQTESEQRIPTFEDDILPLLQSSDTGRVYKCTVCHARYTDIDAVKGSKNFDPILSEARSGGMPLNADLVSEEDVALLQRWADANFPLNAAEVQRQAAEAEAAAEQKRQEAEDRQQQRGWGATSAQNPSRQGVSADTGCQPQSFQ